MTKYLITGVIVQTFIIVLRWVFGKSRGMFKENKLNPFFWFTILLGYIINIMLWPVAIVCEVILTKKGI